MRKVLLSLFLAGVLVLGVVSVSSAAGQRCLHVQYCPGVHPIIKVHTLPAACRAPGSTFTVPNVKVSDVSGIKQITIKLGSKVLLTKKFKGRGPMNYTVKGLKVHTNGLSRGAHKLTIFVKDYFGVTRTRTLRFSICKPPPFTG
jgi:hypothetical protein